MDKSIEEKARELIGCDSLYCASSDANYCLSFKKGIKACRELRNMLLIADFTIEKAIEWLRENCTDYLSKIENTFGGCSAQVQMEANIKRDVFNDILKFIDKL